MLFFPSRSRDVGKKLRVHPPLYFDTSLFVPESVIFLDEDDDAFDEFEDDLDADVDL